MYKTLYEPFDRSVTAHPDRVALRFGRLSFTYADLSEQVRLLATQLRDFGVDRGDRMVICAGNRPETVVGFWAALAVGAVATVISHEQGTSKIRHVLHDSGAVVMLAPATLFQTIIEDGPVALKGAVVLDATAPLGPAPIATVPFPGRTDRAGEPWHSAATISEDLAALVYTSGTTGPAKGVMLSHGNMLAALASLNEYLGNRPDDVFLNVLPLAFDYGLYQMIMAFSVGATLVLERDMVLPLQTLKTIQQHGCTVVPGVPVFFDLIAQFSRLGRFDLSSVRYVTNTGAALLPQHIEAIQRLFPRAAVYSMYGVTECKRCTYLPPHLIDAKPASVGVAIPNTEILIVDEQDRPCPPHQVGQLVVRGATVMQGYWQRPDDTAERIRQHPVRGGRCLYTGDYGYLDDDGCFYFKGRMDDVIKVRGRKLIPTEIEEVLCDIEGVREAVVVCTERADGEHHIAAFVSADNGRVDADVLRTGCRRELESYQMPAQFEICQRLPRNENGKVDKEALRRLFPLPERTDGGDLVGNTRCSA